MLSRQILCSLLEKCHHVILRQESEVTERAETDNFGHSAHGFPMIQVESALSFRVAWRSVIFRKRGVLRALSELLWRTFSDDYSKS